MKLASKRLLCLASSLALASTLAAHRQWILPSTTVLSGENQWISVDAAISNDLYFPNHHAIPLERIQAVSPSGKQLEMHSATEGRIRSSFELLLEEEGSYRIFSMSETMFATWEENGEQQRRRGTEAEFSEMNLSELSDLSLRAWTSRVESIVTSGAPSELATSGKGLEFEFISHPNDLFAGETAEFRVLLNGEPAAEQTVSVVRGNDRFRDTVGEIEVTSDSEGRIEIDWPQPGRYWLQSSAAIPAGEFRGVPLQRNASYTLTLEVLPE